QAMLRQTCPGPPSSASAHSSVALQLRSPHSLSTQAAAPSSISQRCPSPQPAVLQGSPGPPPLPAAPVPPVAPPSGTTRLPPLLPPPPLPALPLLPPLADDPPVPGNSLPPPLSSEPEQPRTVSGRTNNEHRNGPETLLIDGPHPVARWETATNKSGQPRTISRRRRRRLRYSRHLTSFEGHWSSPTVSGLHGRHQR